MDDLASWDDLASMDENLGTLIFTISPDTNSRLVGLTNIFNPLH